MSKRVRGLVAGVWKFEENVARADVDQIAQEWAIGQERDNYAFIAVRGISESAYGIEVLYRLNTHEDVFRYRRRISDQLRRRLGNGLKGWDLSDNLLILKNEIV